MWRRYRAVHIALVCVCLHSTGHAESEEGLGTQWFGHVRRFEQELKAATTPSPISTVPRELPKPIVPTDQANAEERAVPASVGAAGAQQGSGNQEIDQVLVSLKEELYNAQKALTKGIDRLDALQLENQQLKRESSPSRGVWYANNLFHGPPIFPLCSMDVCFNFTKCRSSSPRLGRRGAYPLVFSYSNFSTTYFNELFTSKWYTNDPSKACFFFVFMRDRGPSPRSLTYWGANGANHVLISLSDSWDGPNPASIGMAKLAVSAARLTILRPSFDISIPLPQKWFGVPSRLPDTPAPRRRYFLTFRGSRYLTREGQFRGSPEFMGMHNGKDVIVVTYCGGTTNKLILQEHPEYARECELSKEQARRYKYVDLMNSTFGLAPAGRQQASYRFLEIMSAGAIPVIIADNWKLPFDDVIRWGRCAINFPTSDISHVVPTLRQMSTSEILSRQTACQNIYSAHLSSDKKLFRTMMACLVTQFRGATSSGFH